MCLPQHPTPFTPNEGGSGGVPGLSKMTSLLQHHTPFPPHLTTWKQPPIHSYGGASSALAPQAMNTTRKEKLAKPRGEVLYFDRD